MSDSIEVAKIEAEMEELTTEHVKRTWEYSEKMAALQLKKRSRVAASSKEKDRRIDDAGDAENETVKTNKSGTITTPDFTIDSDLSYARAHFGIRTQKDIRCIITNSKKLGNIIKVLVDGGIKNHCLHLGKFHPRFDLWYFNHGLEQYGEISKLEIGQHRLLYILFLERKFEGEEKEPDFSLKKHGGKKYREGYRELYCEVLDRSQQYASEP